MINYSSVLLTGATGFIGNALLKRLLGYGAMVHCLTRKKISIQHPNINQILIPDFAPEKITGALSKVNAEVIFHLAAYGVKPVERDVEIMAKINFNLLISLISSAHDWPLKQIINLGSSAEYSQSDNNILLTEEHKVDPLTLYGASKVAASIYGKKMAEQLNLPFSHLRLFGVYGPGEASHRLAPSLINDLRKTKKVSLSPGFQVRDFLYIDDVVDALLLVSQLKNQSIICNVSSGKPLTVRDFSYNLANIMQASNDLLAFGDLDYRAGEVMYLVGANDYLQKITSWKPKVTLETGLKKTIAHYMEGDVCKNN